MVYQKSHPKEDTVTRSADYSIQQPKREINETQTGRDDQIRLWLTCDTADHGGYKFIAYLGISFLANLKYAEDSQKISMNL